MQILKKISTLFLCFILILMTGCNAKSRDYAVYNVRMSSNNESLGGTKTAETAVLIDIKTGKSWYLWSDPVSVFKWHPLNDVNNQDK